MDRHEPLLARIERSAQTFSRSQRTLARYVASHYQSVAFATVAQLARTTGVSEATVVRFAHALDFPGYPALQKEIRRLVRADLKGTERFALSARGARSERANALAPVLAKELENLAALRDGFDARAFRQAVRMLAAASQVMVSGARSTASLASHLAFGLGKLGLDTIRATTLSSETFDAVDRLAPRAVLVVIGFPRYLQDQVRLTAHACRARVATLVLTDSVFSPLRGDVSLYVPAESASFVAYHGAPLALLNALLDAVGNADRARTLAALDRFEQVAERERYFHDGRGERTQPSESRSRRPAARGARGGGARPASAPERTP